MSKYLVATKASEDFSALEVREEEVPKPPAGYVLVRNHAISLNPIDWKIYKSGYFNPTWPLTLGMDNAGVVEAVGEGNTEFKVGDRVFGFSDCLLVKKNQYGTFREHTLNNAKSLYKLPESISFEQGASVPLGIFTVVEGIYKPGSPFPRPSPTDKKASDPKETVLVLGGSSSVGAYAVQLLSKHYKVISTASKHNHDLVVKLGATKVFDRNEPDLADKIKAEAGGHIPLVYDAISLAATQSLAAKVVSDGGHVYVTLGIQAELKKATEDRKLVTYQVFAAKLVNPDYEDVNAGWFKGFITKALENGTIVPNETEIIGNDLNAIKGGLIKMANDQVSGAKLIVKLK